MEYAAIDTRDTFNLFDAESMTGSKSVLQEKPRKASNHECMIYAQWLARKAGYCDAAERQPKLIWKEIVKGRGNSGVKICIGADFGGGVSVQFPGHDQINAPVLFERLDASGNVEKAYSIFHTKGCNGPLNFLAEDSKAIKSLAKLPLDPPAASSVEIEAPTEAQEPEAQAVPELPPISAIEEAPAIETPPACENAPQGPENGNEDIEEAASADIEAAGIPENEDDSAGPDPIAALIARIEALEARVHADPEAIQVDAPLSVGSVAPPIAAKGPSREARLRIARRYLEMRAERDTLKRERDDYQAGLNAYAETLFQARKKATVQRRRLIILARKSQKRLYSERKALQSQISALKAKPHHFGNAVHADDVEFLKSQRADWKAKAEARQEKVNQLTHALNRGTDLLEEMSERALKAEIALRAIHKREERGTTPYRVNSVRFAA